MPDVDRDVDAIDGEGEIVDEAEDISTGACRCVVEGGRTYR